MSSLNAGDRRHKLMNDKQRHSLYILFYLIRTEIYDVEYFFRFSEKNSFVRFFRCIASYE